MSLRTDSDIFQIFKHYFDCEDKESAVLFILEKLRSNELDVLTLYTDILAPCLSNLECRDEPALCIWKEHIKTGIVRTILECCYPYILEKQRKLGALHHPTAVILCPPDEYHDIGARMAADFLTICGCHSIYVGSNTPYKNFYDVIQHIHPDLIAISVSNYYHLVVTKKIIEEVKAAVPYSLLVIVGGYAFKNDPEKYHTVAADFYAETFEDIKSIIDSLPSLTTHS